MAWTNFDDRHRSNFKMFIPGSEVSVLVPDASNCGAGCALNVAFDLRRLGNQQRIVVQCAAVPYGTAPPKSPAEHERASLQLCGQRRDDRFDIAIRDIIGGPALRFNARSTTAGSKHPA